MRSWIGVALFAFLALLMTAGPSRAEHDASKARHASGWTCVPLGRKCTFSSDCCSKNCVSDPKLGKVCKKKS